METLASIAFIISLIATLLIMPKLIPFLHKIKFSQTEREEGLASHKVKTGTPTMGGLVFVVVPVIVSAILNPHILLNHETQIILLAYLGYALIGFIDDFIIVVKKNNEGLKPLYKFIMQSILAIVFFLMYINFVGETTLWIPIAKTYVDIGPIFFFILIFIMFTAESNAVNLTDGLDGLCAGISIIALIPFILFAHSAQMNDEFIFMIALLGSLLGYLWFNKHPAKIFMGDSGSLALGGLFAAVALVEKKELLLIVIGGVFLVETLSVVIQVVSFKTRGKRVFKMAPLHHHYEAKGMKEVQVVKMFYLAELILALVGYVMGVI